MRREGWLTTGDFAKASLILWRTADGRFCDGRPFCASLQCRPNTHPDKQESLRGRERRQRVCSWSTRARPACPQRNFPVRDAIASLARLPSGVSYADALRPEPKCVHSLKPQNKTRAKRKSPDPRCGSSQRRRINDGPNRSGVGYTVKSGSVGHRVGPHPLQFSLRHLL